MHSGRARRPRLPGALVSLSKHRPLVLVSAAVDRPSPVEGSLVAGLPVPHAGPGVVRE
jgi:hypothetical protein